MAQRLRSDPELTQVWQNPDLGTPLVGLAECLCPVCGSIRIALAKVRRARGAPVRGPCIELPCRHVAVGVLVWKMVPPAATRRLVGWAHAGRVRGTLGPAVISESHCRVSTGRVLCPSGLLPSRVGRSSPPPLGLSKILPI